MTFLLNIVVPDQPLYHRISRFVPNIDQNQKVMAETKGALSLEKFCLKAIAEKIALHCKDSRQNVGLPYHDITFSRLG